MRFHIINVRDVRPGDELVFDAGLDAGYTVHSVRVEPEVVTVSFGDRSTVYPPNARVGKIDRWHDE